MTTWSIYLLRCSDGSLYTGIATDVERRLDEHRSGKGAKALRGRAPLELVTTCSVGDRGVAQRVEYRFKQLPKVEKESLIGPRAFRDWVAETASGDS